MLVARTEEEVSNRSLLLESPELLHSLMLSEPNGSPYESIREEDASPSSRDGGESKGGPLGVRRVRRGDEETSDEGEKFGRKEVDEGSMGLEESEMVFGSNDVVFRRRR